MHEKTLLGFFGTPRNKKCKLAAIERCVYYLDDTTGNFVVIDLHNFLDLYQKEIQGFVI